MANMIDLSIVIPVHNEHDRLWPGVETLYDYLLHGNWLNIKYEVILVENGSTDDTLTHARLAARQFPHLHVFSIPKAGKGLAVSYGVMEAKGSYILMSDIDWSVPPNWIPHFWARRDPNVILIGDRELPASARYNEPWQRHLAGRVFNWLTQWLLLPGLYDTQCGFKMFPGSAAVRLFGMLNPENSGWAFDVEVLYYAKQLGYTIEPQPVPWLYDGNSRIKLGRDALEMVKQLWRIRRQNAAKDILQNT